MDELGPMLFPAAAGVFGVLLGFLWGRVKVYAASTPATWDDELVAKVEEIVGRQKEKPNA